MASCDSSATKQASSCWRFTSLCATAIALAQCFGRLDGKGNSQVDDDVDPSFVDISTQHLVERLTISDFQSPANGDFTPGHKPEKHPGGANRIGAAAVSTLPKEVVSSSG